VKRHRTLLGLAVAIAAALAGWWLGTTTGDSSPPPATTTVTVTVTDGGPPTIPTVPDISGTDPESGLPWIAVTDLPPEARETLDLIESDGPFPYDRDGVVFQNREGILPDEERGYYHEYTVVTPGSDDRGARRIVTGANAERYYTDDHYDSFRRIRP
jgi:ribonuclease T1